MGEHSVRVNVPGNHDADAEGRTPGPWYIESHGIMDATRSRTICLFGDSDQDSADQTLVALAPTLRDALAELVALKDGPRDVAYKQRQPIAWGRAREVLDALNIGDAGAHDVATDESGHGGSDVLPTQRAEADEGERCQVCGDTYTDVYRLPDEWWALVTPKPEHPDAGLLCPDCALHRLMHYGEMPTGGAEHG